MRIFAVFLMSCSSSYRSDADVFHVQLIATLVKVRVCVRAHVCVNHWRGGWGVRWASLYCRSYSAYLKLYDRFISDSPSVSVSERIQTKVTQTCNSFVIGDQFLHL